MRDPLLIGLLVVESDVDPVLHRSSDVDDPINASEDRTYPLFGVSGVAARDIKLIRLFRRCKRRGQHQKHKRRTDQAEGSLSDHSVSSPSWSALFTGRDVTARYRSFLRQKRGNNPGKNLVVDSVLDFSRKW